MPGSGKSGSNGEPGHHSRAGQIYATAGGSLVRSAEVSGGNCHENVTQVAENGGKSAAIDNK